MDGSGSRSETVDVTARTANGANGAAALVIPPIRPMHQDLEPHVEAWENFIALTKWSTIGIIVILALLAVFLL